MRDLQLPGRSVVHAVKGAAATSHPVSTMAAIDTLRKGGTAVDAAIAACAVQCVVEPMSTGIGGDCFSLVVPPGESRPVGLNASGFAPAGLTAEIARKDDGERVGLQSPHAVTIPGAIAGWQKLHDRFGRLPWWQVLQPAIDAAEDGFAITPRVAVDWERAGTKLHDHEHAARHWLRDGAYPKAGQRFAAPALAAVLKAVATDGADAFYRGWVAEDLVETLNAVGGRHAMADFAEYEPEFVEPISTDYRGHTVWQIPPNGQGATTLLMLNILEGLDLPGLDPVGVERLHLETEASRLAYAARDAHIADPKFVDVPVERLLSRDYAAQQRGRIGRDSVMENVAELSGHVYRDTVYLTVVDRERMVCSFINSLYFPFGSGLCGNRTGILLQNRGAGFSLVEGHPNCLAPRKRPRHTIIPALASRDGRPFLSFGVMGGDYQPVGQCHVLTNIVDYGMDVQEALDCPRVFYNGGRLDVERGVPTDVRAALAALGHNVTTPEMPWGGGQAIMLDWDNDTLAAGSDPRKDGCALGW
ncbi:gamma-glutamyltransferase [Marinibaculum pumilum]|uniref:Glutathione hydrolase proenzyme n=1 Tax=Marinibaculum pumilum TaxID=1766165 RepID=A0ABV7L6M8_9PROT